MVGLQRSVGSRRFTELGVCNNFGNRQECIWVWIGHVFEVFKGQLMSISVLGRLHLLCTRVETSSQFTARVEVWHIIEHNYLYR